MKKLIREEGAWTYRTFPMDERYPRILETLKNSDKPMSAREISEQYIENPNFSDALVTGTILNVLSLAGIVTKHVKFQGKSNRVSFELKR